MNAIRNRPKSLKPLSNRVRYPNYSKKFVEKLKKKADVKPYDVAVDMGSQISTRLHAFEVLMPDSGELGCDMQDDGVKVGTEA